MKKVNRLDKRRETRQKNESWFQVKSQTSSFDLWHDVLLTETDLKCDCPEYSNSNLKCKHIFTIENRYPQTRTKHVLDIKEEIEIVKTINLTSIKCHKCYSTNIKRFDIRKNKNQVIQKCNSYFSGKIGFKNMHALLETITLAMQLYFTGESLRNISKALKLRRLNFTHVSIYKWIKRYTKLLDVYAKTITPKVGSKWYEENAVICSSFMRLAECTPLLKIELFGAGHDECRIKDVIDHIVKNNVYGYPYSLRMAHDTCKVSGEDMQRFSHMYGLCNETSSKDVLG